MKGGIAVFALAAMAMYRLVIWYSNMNMFVKPLASYKRRSVPNYSVMPNGTRARPWAASMPISLSRLRAEMHDEAVHEGGGCVVAMQVNVPLTVVYVRDLVSSNEGPLVINPRVVQRGGDAQFSKVEVNGVSKNVLTHKKVQVEFIGAYLERVVLNMTGVAAKCVQTAVDFTFDAWR